MDAPPKLDAPRTIAEIARTAGWSLRRMKRHLLRVNEEVHGMLLVASQGSNRRWLVRVSVLRHAAPELFEYRDLEGEIRELRAHIAELEREQESSARHAGELVQRIAELEEAQARAEKRIGEIALLKVPRARSAAA
jgi:Sec-independent protein translocase protein TatA